MNKTLTEYDNIRDTCLNYRKPRDESCIQYNRTRIRLMIL